MAKEAAQNKTPQTKPSNKQKETKPGQVRDFAFLKLMVIFVQSIVIVVLVWLAFFHFPQTNYLWTRDAKSVCKATELTYASVHHATIRQFAQDAATSLNTFDYLNYPMMLSNATDRYFTPQGRKQYYNALDASEVIKNVIDNYFVVTSHVNNAPQIIVDSRKSDFRGTPFWKVQVPITIWYAAGEKRYPEDRLLTMMIVAVDPSPTNPEGIAIDTVISSQRAKS